MSSEEAPSEVHTYLSTWVGTQVHTDSYLKAHSLGDPIGTQVPRYVLARSGALQGLPCLGTRECLVLPSSLHFHPANRGAYGYPTQKDPCRVPLLLILNINPGIVPVWCDIHSM